MPALPSTGGPSRQLPTRPSVVDRRHAATRFRTALATGDYYALMGPGLRRARRGAANDEGSEFRNALLQELEAYERELAAQD